MGWAVFPPCYLTWGKTLVEVMKIMVTFERSHACTATLSASNSAAGHHQPAPLPETLGPSRASLGQSFVGSLLLSPGSWCTQGFVCALQESVSSILCKFWWLYRGVNGDLLQRDLWHTQVYCTQSPWPRSSSLLTCTSSGDTQTQFCLSLCGVSGSWCIQGMFEPSEHLWWVWGLIPNMILPLLPSYWGFSFALGCWVSPQSHPSAMQSPLHRLPFFWGFSALGCGIYLSVYTFKASQMALVVKKLPANTGDVRDASLILGSGRSLGGGHGNPFPYTYLTNLMDGAAWWATDHRDAKSQTWLKQLSTHAYTFNIWYSWMYTDLYLFYLNAIILFRGPYLIRWFQVYVVKVYIDDPHIHIIFQLQIFSSIFGSGMLTEICKLKFLDSFAMISASCIKGR